jgi:hypothetical protein
MITEMIEKNKRLYRKKNWMYEIDPVIVISDLRSLKNELENLDYEILNSDISKEYISKRLKEIME